MNRPRRARRPWRLFGRPKRGKILATKLGFNPNSSSLGVDVTFLLFGATAVSIMTPIIAALVRAKLRRKPQPEVGDAAIAE